MKRFILSSLNVIIFAILIYVSATVNAREVFASSSPSVIMPAGYAFSIWLVIYTGLFAFVISQFFVSDQAFKLYEKLSLFFVPALFFTTSSLLVPSTLAPVVIALAVLMVSGLYVITRQMCHRYLEKGCVYLNILFSTYLGWLSVALILNLTNVLNSSPLGTLLQPYEVVIGCVVLILGALLACYICKTKQDRVYPLVFIWAYIAIAVAQLSIYPIVITICAMIVLMAFFLERVK